VQTAFGNNAALLSPLQFNQRTRQLSTNIRFRWILRPCTDFFVVNNELDAWQAGLGPRNRSLVAKLAWLFTL